MADFSRFTGKGETEEVTRHNDPKQESMSPVEKEQSPTYYQRTLEREGRSEWSGGNMGGGSWAGRSR